MAGDPGEAELIRQLRDRNPDGLAAAYDRYGHIVYSVFLRVTRDAVASEDLVQELFMRVWNRAKHFDASKGTLGVWIVSIARNMAIDHVRSAQARFATRLRPIEHAQAAVIPEGSRRTDDLLHNAETVRAALDGLNSNQKKVLELAYFEGFSQTEIAAKLQEPLGTVKSWMRSALLRLRHSLQGSEA